MNEDIFGSKLFLNDIVAFNPPRYKGLVFARVIGFTTKSIRVQFFLDRSVSFSEFENINPENLKTTTTTQVVKKY